MNTNISRNMIVVLVAVVAGATLVPMAQHALATAENKKDEPVAVRYAKAYLQLAEAQLAVAQRANRRVAGSFSAAQVDAYREDVEVCKGLVQEANQGQGFDRMQALVQLADYRVEDSRRSIRLLELANQQSPGAIDEGRINVLRAYEALATLDFETGKAALTASPPEQMQWRVTVLEDEVLRLREEVSRLRSRK